jgi:predicted Zn-dependent peptidase
VKTAEVIAEAERLFGGLPAAAPPPITPPPPPPAAVTREVIEVAGAQAQILIGGFAPTLSQPDHAAVKVLAAVLGGGMAGRFFSELRDKQGLAYTTGMAYPSRLDRGYIVAHLGTGPENVERAEAALRAELDRIQREPVPEAELQVAKSYLLGNLAMDRRTNARQAWYMNFYELAGVGQEFLDRYTAQVKAVTLADVQRVARQYLGTLRTVIVRPPAR